MIMLETHHPTEQCLIVDSILLSGRNILRSMFSVAPRVPEPSIPSMLPVLGDMQRWQEELSFLASWFRWARLPILGEVKMQGTPRLCLLCGAKKSRGSGVASAGVLKEILHFPLICVPGWPLPMEIHSHVLLISRTGLRTACVALTVAAARDNLPAKKSHPNEDKNAQKDDSKAKK